MQKITLNTPIPVQIDMQAPVHSNQNTNVHINESGYGNSKTQYKVKENIIAKRKRQKLRKPTERGVI